MKNWFLIVVFFCCAIISRGQTKCDNLIEEATDLFNSGNYNECIRVLEKGLKDCSLSKGKKEKAYILLVNSNIEKDSIQAVERDFKRLLLNNPAFKLKDYDGIDDFKTSFRNYYVYPKFSVGVGLTYVRPTIAGTGNYQVVANINNDEPFVASKFFCPILTADFRVFERVALFGDMTGYTINYHRTIKNSFWELESKERLNYFQWNAGVKLFFNTQKKLNFYVLSGMGNMNLLSSELELYQGIKKITTTNMYSNSADAPVDSRGKIASHKNLRNRYVSSFIVGAGILFKHGNLGYGLDWKGSITLNTLNKQKNRLAEPELVEKFSYMDQDLRILKSEYSVVITYMFNKVKTKK